VIDLSSLKESFSMTLITSLFNNGPIIFNLQKESNTQYNYVAQ